MGRAFKALARILRDEPGLGYVPIGFLERSSVGNATEVAGLPVLGHVSDAAKHRHVAQTVILTTPKSAPNGFGHMVRDLPFPRILMVPELTQFPSLWVSTRDLSGILALELPQNLLRRRNRVIKEISDYVLTVPLFLVSLSHRPIPGMTLGSCLSFMWFSHSIRYCRFSAR